MDNFFISNNSLVKIAITAMRDINTQIAEFNQNVERVSGLLISEALASLPLVDKTVDTPVAKAQGHALVGDIVFVPIIRAGLGMVSAAKTLIPSSKVGLIGMKRDEDTAIAYSYYHNIPKLTDDDTIVVLDPMLATGGSLSDAIYKIKECGATKIMAVTIFSAPEGVSLVSSKHPDVLIYTGVLDDRLNEKKYIVPGLGDAGDRIFGTL